MKSIGKHRRTDWVIIAALALAAVMYVLLHDLIGGTLLAHSDWDSYTLQAMAWRQGRFDLGRNYEWLELAIYNGGYYVSFPPVPSVLLLPFTFIFGADTPNNLIIMLVTLGCLLLVYYCCRRTGRGRFTSLFWAVFAVFGSNLLWMSTNGGVWFMAQACAMAFSLGAVLCALCGKRYVSLALIALAVGCRPFTICLAPVLLWLFVQSDMRERGLRFFAALLRQWRYLIAPAVIGAAYMAFNYARFGNVLEFGHNYLPEFLEAPKGQFDLSYIPQNLYNIFLRPVTFDAGGKLTYPLFDGFMFYIANPIFLVWFAYIAIDIVKKRMNATRLLIIGMFVLELLLLCAHKTFGGWQFGARYTVDLIPLALLFILRSPALRPRGWEAATAVFAVMFNIYGALAMTVLA